ncbi:hypothetical protein ACVWZ4_000771 [Bradyrhizobium sp. USDA 4472]
MMNGHGLLVAGALFIGLSFPAKAQGTYTITTTRGGYTGSTYGTPDAPKAPATSRYVAPAPRNPGTGQGRTEGAMGLTPQLQRELGISRQQ